MRATKLIALSSALLFLGACPDKEKNASIEEMNKGIEAASTGSYETALKHLEKAVKSYDKNHQAWYNTGQIYARTKRWKKAADAFSKAAQHHEAAMYRLNLGISQYEIGQKKQAVGNLEKAVAKEKNLYKGWWYLGRAYRDTGKPKKAAEAWTRACTVNPLYGPPFVRLGELYYRWDQPDKAIKVLSQGTAYAKDSRDRTNIFYYLGLSYYVKKDWNKAIEAFSNALEERNDNDQARFQRGMAYKNAGKKMKARKDLEAFGKSGGSAFDKQQANRALGELLAGSSAAPPDPKKFVPPTRKK